MTDTKRHATDVAVPDGVRDAAWRAYLAEDQVSAAIDAAIRETVVGVREAARPAIDRILTRHARRPDGRCVMCRWADGSLAAWPCPDYLDAKAAADVAVGGVPA